MYGTVIRCRPRAGKEQALMEMSRRWWEERSAKAGCKAEYVYRSETHPGELVVAVVFESKEAYQRNASDPEQDRWFRELRELLEADPEWDDGAVVQSFP